MSTWNGNRFSVYTSEEKQVLKLIEELGNQTNYNTDLVEKLFDQVLPENVLAVLNDWYENGKLLDIINYNAEISIERYKNLFVGNDVTLALKQAIVESPKGSTIKFNPINVYELSDTIVIAKPIVINFNNATVGVKVGGKPVFDIQFTGETDFNNRIKLINYNFTKVIGYIPTTIIFVNGAINSILQGCMNECKASHSLIWNYKGYGTHILGETRWADCPRVIYLSNSSDEIHSFAFNIDMDISGNTGKGIETEGANGLIKGVIESCLSGGYHFNGIHNATGINIAVHFENNTLFDMKIGNATHVVNGATNSGNHIIIGALFSRTVNKSILYGSDQVINIIGCQLNSTPEPIDATVNSTTINTMGNLGVYNEVLTTELVKLNYSLNQWGNHKVNKIQTNELTTKQIKSETAEGLSIFLPNNKQLYANDIELKPSAAGYNLGARWNMFKRIYAENTYLKSPNGKVWQLNISNTGVITPYEEA